MNFPVIEKALREVTDMVQIKHLNVTHKKDMRTLVEDLSFTLNPGDKAALIGEEGNGKSTILKLLYEDELVEDYVEYTGEIIKNNEVLGYLAQELKPWEKEKTVYEFLAEEPAFFDMSAKELALLAQKMGISLELLYEDRSLGSLSGGEQIKVQFIRMLSRRPTVLLLDEPSNDIDIETLEWLESFINACREPILYISHDEVLLERTANMIIHLEQVKRKTQPRYTVEKTDYRTYVNRRSQNFLRQEQLARKERSEYEKQQERFRKIQQKVEHQQNAITRQDPHGGRLLKKKMHAVKALEHRFEREYAERTEMPDAEEAIFFKLNGSEGLPNGKRVLEMYLPKLVAGGTSNSSRDGQSRMGGPGMPEDKEWKEERVLAENIQLNVSGAEKICIIGRNGVGKTTLLRQIAGQLLPRRDIKAAYMPQNYDDLLRLPVTPVEYLSNTGDKEEETRICTWLGSLKYTADEMSHPIGELSGGQKAKLLLLKMSMSGANVLILDEPTRNFSPLSNPVIRKHLKNFDGAIISISHDRKYIQEVCDKVYRLTEKGLKEEAWQENASNAAGRGSIQG